MYTCSNLDLICMYILMSLPINACMYVRMYVCALYIFCITLDSLIHTHNSIDIKAICKHTHTYIYIYVESPYVMYFYFVTYSRLRGRYSTLVYIQKNTRIDRFILRSCASRELSARAVRTRMAAWCFRNLDSACFGQLNQAFFETLSLSADLQCLSTESLKAPTPQSRE